MVRAAHHAERVGARRCCRGFLGRAVVALIALLGVVAWPLSTVAQVASEYDVKAAFLYNFAKFVEWPAQAFPAIGEPFSLCIFGDDPFGGYLERVVEGKSVQDRTLAVRHLAHVEDTAPCQMIFIGTSELSQLHGILATLTDAPVLTVGDTEDIVYRGGMIGFHMVGNRVRFLINQDAVERVGLHVSSQLLKVADKVITTDAQQ